MECFSCKTEILASFKHAFVKNECPACGGKIMAEEKLALISDVENTIMAEIGEELKEESRKKIATILVAKYMDDGKKVVLAQSKEEIKIAKPSIIAKQAEIAGITDQERDKIFTEAVNEKYNMATLAIGMDKPKQNPQIEEREKTEFDAMFNNDGGILEQERVLRLMKQKSVIEGGGAGKNSFRRSD